MHLRIIATLACASVLASAQEPGLALDAHLKPGAPPAFLLGQFEDDYGNRFRIDSTDWVQQPRSRYHIVKWVPERQYLIARNDSANVSDAGLWTRIDWLKLDGMPPYEWGFCLSAYKAPTAAAAESTTVARRETPRTGCNGFPFSRMKRAS